MNDSGTNEKTKIFHANLFGKREHKYEFLGANSVSSVKWEEINPQHPFLLFVPQNMEMFGEYEEGFKISDLFGKTLLGPNSHRDPFAIAFTEKDATTRINDFFDKSFTDEEIRTKYELEDNRDWNLHDARSKPPAKLQPVKCLYRPFDFRFMLYGDYAFDYCRPEINDNLIYNNNFALISTRQTKESFSVFITKDPVGQHKLATPYDGSYLSPLYLYPDGDELNLDEGKEKSRVPNLNMEIVAKFAEKIGLEFKSNADIPVCNSNSTTGIRLRQEATTGQAEAQSFTPENLLDYIYAVLHSPNYREKYKEFLKIDFPRIPLPENTEQFWKFVEKGCELRKLHLMESPDLDKPITSYPVSGSNVVEKVAFKCGTGVPPVSSPCSKECGTGVPPVGASFGKVFINTTQYFDNVPEISWNFYIGGYQPAQKWLKDRKSRTLSYDDIIHYQKIIVALKKTKEIMKDIEKIRMF